MNAVLKPDIENVRDRVSNEEWDLQAGGGPMHAVPRTVLDNIDEQVDMATRGQFGSLAWPGLLRKLDRQNPGYRE